MTAMGEGGQGMIGPYSLGRVHHGDALECLRLLPDGCVDAVITDPPYSSGGAVRGDRISGSSLKYAQVAAVKCGAFSGDTRDQRGWAYWMTLWLGEALRVTKAGGFCMLWCDWRQLPAATDCLQSGGWIWRGIIPWAKPDARPQMGRFSCSCEYVVCGTAGAREITGDCVPGYWIRPMMRERIHAVEKPVDVCEDLLRPVPEEGIVLDCFAGSGTTALACNNTGRSFLGFEIDAHWVQEANDRLDRERARLGEVRPADAKANQQIGLLCEVKP